MATKQTPTLRTPLIRKPVILVTEFMRGEASGGFVLMAAAALALVVANSPAAPLYFESLHARFGGLGVLHWINDGLMAIFFLFVGLEIKREMLVGQLSSWSRRMLPGIGALGGMIVPALIYVAFNRNHPEALRGWAIPAATDIAFALGVLALLGKRVPTSIKVFLAALAIIDDLGAVLIIALFYTSELSMLHLLLAAAVLILLVVLNKTGVRRLTPYLVLGAILWFLVLKSGVHATVAGVVLALTIPLRMDNEFADPPLITLEHSLNRVVPFLIVPLFGFANAGLSFDGLTWANLVDPLTLGVALGLLCGKIIGVFGFSSIAIGTGIARLPQNASWMQMFGVAMLCGIGFTMSLFIGMLAFADNPVLQSEVKVGILCGSLAAGVLGYLTLRLARRRSGDESELETTS
ncbi:Na+/H+ antiporter NhaA [Dokdonella sp.]|uniref:Na+/H+ antiporter NhaA n=2 Tax=Dokdonella sp. TaxID=2291710 RepID=UPI002C77A27E|nr:Na+/H+ antiporter NhaA [Xanthomonadales bacterium]HQX64831.1 Na+/H+ antiporter NhaA [Dokdonella sp.]HQY53854.1 Na+/H+ antiporter NhaA [Dokdonella sp.]HQZ62991.1 Na+/H+ antiporter NhaA [Dokdonella sp.]